MTNFFIFAGEPSGDLHGSHLIHALKERFHGCTISGVGGPHMRQEGMNVLMPTEQFEVMGFSDVLIALPGLIKKFFCVRNAILKQTYAAVILIDYPGFNLRLAKSLRNKGYEGKIVQYISPTVWAHGKHRIQHMAETLDLLLTIYPFELECFDETSLRTVYVGNPLQEYLSKQKYDAQWRTQVGLQPEDEFVALFPGSREGEIKRNLPAQLEAADSLKQVHPALRFAISCAHVKSQELIAQAMQSTSLNREKDIVCVPKKFTHEMMNECRTALAKSGTVTLELALRQRPTVVTYQLTSLNKFIGKYIVGVNLPHYCIVNILGKQTIFPEFVESNLPRNEICKELHKLHAEGDHRRSCIEKCRTLKDVLGEQYSSRSAVKAIAEIMS